MTQDEIIEMAKRSGLNMLLEIGGMNKCLEHFAKLVAKRTWVGLTAKEKHEFRYSHMTTADFIEDIEAKLKDKNT